MGCKVNTYDTDLLETQFKAKGFEIVADPSKAQISILNSCSVTSNADREARYLLRKFRRDCPESLVVATGCYAQTDSAKLSAMKEVDLVFPNQSKDQLVNFLTDHVQKNVQLPKNKMHQEKAPVRENRQTHFKSSLTMFAADTSRTRAFLKIQDGCNGFCSYCIIPYARGASRSAEPNEVLEEIDRIVEKGVKEIVFTGIHIGDYGKDLSSQADISEPFIHLMENIYGRQEMSRIRISSLEPREVSEPLLKIMATRKEISCDHFHLPLQSGCNKILKGMRRTYTKEEYAEKVALIRSYFPDASIGADVIPGFPGETDTDFEETVTFIKDNRLSYLHVFPYSKRPNTAAIRMKDHVDGNVIKDRSAQLRQLSKTLKSSYAEKFIGQTTAVLWEKESDSRGRALGKSMNYLDICVPAHTEVAPGQVSNVKIKGFVEDGVLLGLSK